jgi:hypothetical protein
MHRPTLRNGRKRIAALVFAATLVLGTLCAARAAVKAEAVKPMWTADVLAQVDTFRQIPSVDGSAIIAATNDGLTAFDAGTGKRIWHFSDALEAVAGGGVVYANRITGEPGGQAVALLALDARTGHVLWSRPAGGGTLATDADGVVVANQRGVASYAAAGTVRWFLPTTGGYHRLLVNGEHVIALSERSGAILHGEIESIDRRTGGLIGSQIYFGSLLAVQAHRAQGESDFPGDFDTWCGDAQLLDVSLDRAAGAFRGLDMQRSDFVLENLAPTTPPPGAATYQTATQCTGARFGHPAIILDGAHVVLASGSVLGIFDRSSPGAPFALYRDATFVGGPFAGRLYVQRPHGLDTLTIGDTHTPRFVTLAAGAGAAFSVAGLDDRLYVSDGTTVRALDAHTFEQRADYAIGCTHVSAVLRTPSADVLTCERGREVSQMVALRR